MEICIGEKYKITSDAYNVIINQRYQKESKEGEEIKFDYKSIGFYPNVEKACIALLDKELRESEAKAIKDLMIEIKNAKLAILAGIEK
ncbi:hypothetical protein [Bacillus cereus group sp. BfR-BA-01700]|uniref:hypothetical protein n=1 Tax=Bacillus cereus group sp. BfR-BA-01700 TaxID=3094884 RepID=UPI003D17979C